MFIEAIKMSFKTLIVNKLRTFLTVLGIVIGISSLVAIMSTIAGAEKILSSELSSLGGTSININISRTNIKNGLSAADLETFASLDHVTGVSPTLSAQKVITYNNLKKSDIYVYGKNEVYYELNSKEILYGRPINAIDLENKSRVVVIEDKLRKEWFQNYIPLDETIKINGTEFTIIGISSSNSTGLDMFSERNSVIIPYTTAQSILLMGVLRNVDIYFEADTDMFEAYHVLERTLKLMFNGDTRSYSLLNTQEILDTLNLVTSITSGLLAGISAISLLVGGIGIMNMMLVSVVERTNEIGLKKALGATPNIIKLQFIIESIMISIIGGIIGFIAGIVGALIIKRFVGITPVVTMRSVMLAISFSGTVGIVFGYLPAAKASKLKPIEALRRS